MPACVALMLTVVAPWAAAHADIPDTQAAATACQTGQPGPAYAPLDGAPAVRYLKDTPLSALPMRPICDGVAMPASATFLELAGTFRMAAGRQQLLARIGNVSDLLHVRYWSTSDHQWRPLLSAATALTAEGRPRADFTPIEVDSGRDLYFSQTDSRSSKPATYRMRLKSPAAQRVVLEVENVSPLRWWGVTLYEPGALQSLYVLEQRAADVWSYYSLTTVGDVRWPRSGHVNSYINRVVAMYRHYAGMQTDSEPPPAP